LSNIVAIVGRPNVGKSTLFNKLIGGRRAIVKEVSGVTRDRHYGKSDWNGKEFSLIDTGGYVVGSDDVFEAEIDKQVELAIDEADAILKIGFEEEMNKIIKLLPKERVTLLFSATMTKKVEDLCRLSLKNPVLVEVAKESTSSTV